MLVKIATDIPMGYLYIWKVDKLRRYVFLYFEKCRTLNYQAGSDSKLLFLPSFTSNISHSFEAIEN